MAVLKMVVRLENLAYAAAAHNRTLSELGPSSSEDELETALLRSRKVRFEFDRCSTEIDGTLADLVYKYRNSEDASLRNVWKHWNFVENGEGRQIYPADSEIHGRIMAESFAIGWITKYPHWLDPAKVFDHDRFGPMWFFAVLRLWDLCNDSHELYYVHQLNRLRDAGYIDDRDMYNYAGKVLGRKTDPFFYIKPFDIQSIEKNLQKSRSYHNSYFSKFEKYCSFSRKTRARHPEVIDKINAYFQPVARSTSAYAEAFRRQVESGAKSFDQLWSEYIAMRQHFEKRVYY